MIHRNKLKWHINSNVPYLIKVSDKFAVDIKMITMVGVVEGNNVVIHLAPESGIGDEEQVVISYTDYLTFVKPYVHCEINKDLI